MRFQKLLNPARLPSRAGGSHFCTSVAPNLTKGRGGVGNKYSNADWEHTIRHGVGRNGRALVIMPARFLIAYSDEDLSTLISYLQSIPPVDNELPDQPSRKRAISVTGYLACKAVGKFYSSWGWIHFRFSLLSV